MCCPCVVFILPVYCTWKLDGFSFWLILLECSEILCKIFGPALMGVSGFGCVVAVTWFCFCMFQAWPPGIQCQVCHMTFSDQSAVNAHYDTSHAQSNTRRPPARPEHPDARHKCEVCGGKFMQKSNLSLHLRTVHNADLPRPECDV